MNIDMILQLRTPALISQHILHLQIVLFYNCCLDWRPYPTVLHEKQGLKFYYLCQTSSSFWMDPPLEADFSSFHCTCSCCSLNNEWGILRFLWISLEMSTIEMTSLIPISPDLSSKNLKCLRKPF